MHTKLGHTPRVWTTPGDIIGEVLADLHIDEVRDFLVHGPPLMDVHYLTSSEHVEKGISCTASTSIVTDPRCAASSDPNGLRVHLTIPTHCHDEYAYGLGVTSHLPSAHLQHASHSTDQLYHVVFNVRKRRTLVVTIDDEHQVAIVSQTFKTNGQTTSFMLYFELAEFRSAVERRVDEKRLLGALKQVHFSQVDKSITFPRILPSDTGSTLVGDSFPAVFKEGYLELAGADNNFGLCVRSRYEQGQCVHSAPYYMYDTHSFGTHPGTVELLTSWAARRALFRLQPVPQAPITSQIDSVHSDRTHQMPFEPWQVEQQRAVENRQMRSAVRIAPATRVTRPVRKLSHAEQLDAIRVEKLERRRRNNRIAAARSNAKRRSASKKKAS